MPDQLSRLRIPFSVEILAVIVAAWIAYSPALQNGFVYDDERYVLKNPRIQAPFDLGAIFSETYPPGERERGLYRPLVTVSYCVDARLWGAQESAQSYGFHRTNLLWHALNCALLLAILRRLGLPKGARLAAALIFAVHPVLSEAVAWVVGRAELMGLSMGLLALGFLLWRPSGPGLAGAGLFWVLAMFCKENWVVWPGLVAVVAVCVPSALPMDRSRAIRWGLCAVLIGAGFWWLRYSVLGSCYPPVSAYGSIGFFSRISTALMVLWKYVGLWFWPASLSVHHDIRPIHLLSGVIYLAGWLTAGWAAWKAREVFPWGLLAFGWYWVAMLPSSNLVAPIGAMAGERFMYAGTLFFAPALVEGLRKLFFWSERWRIPAAVFVAAVVLLLLARLQWRLEDWRSNLNLWQSAIRCYPDCYGIKAQLVTALLEKKQFAEAHTLAKEAMAQGASSPQPFQKYHEPRLARAIALAEDGMKQDAWQRQFMRAQFKTGMLPPEEAVKVFLPLMDRYSDQPQLRETLGDLYLRMNRPSLAAPHFEAALKKAPSDMLRAKLNGIIQRGTAEQSRGGENPRKR